MVLSSNDTARIAAVRATGLLDSEVEEVFDRLTRLAVRLVRVPAAFISLVDEHRDFYKSACGFGEPLATERELRGPTFCHYTIQRETPLVIPDTAADPVYRDVPTIRTLGVAAYVGVPLVVDGQTIGAFCAIDDKPRAWTDDEVEILVELAASAQREIVVRGVAAAAERAVNDLRLRQADLERANGQLRDQATELELQTEELQVTTEELEERTTLVAESEQRYRTMAESVPVQVWTATRDGNLNFINGTATQFFAVGEHALLGSGWTSFVHPDDLPVAAQRWSHSLATGEPYETEFRLRNGSTGEYHWHVARALPVRAYDQTILGWSGSNTDVEGERSARAAAEEANRGKSEFLATMSHELRTPLNAIGGYTQLLEAEIKGAINADQRDFLDRLSHAQRHLLSLINSILNYAKIDAGAVLYADEDISINQLLATCESLTMPQIRASALTLAYDSCLPDLIARGDGEKVQQIMLNLLSNAIKFTDKGRIAIRCEQRNAREIEIAVADTGRGIPAGEISRLFQPFVQIDANLTRTKGGTGLGLTISREMARAMGGDLRVTSVSGEGSTFTLVLRSAG